MLTITTAASDLNLLTPPEIRAATGLAATDGSQDARLTTLGQRMSATIAAACNIARAGTAPPTLRSETLTEVFRPARSNENLSLSRRPITSVTSVSEDGTSVAASGYEIEAATGLLGRLDSDEPSKWAAAKITVVYVAGWATVPDDLKEAASKLSAVLWSEGQRTDPSLKRESIPGVIDREWWVGPSDDPLIPTEIMGLLAPYIEHWI